MTGFSMFDYFTAGLRRGELLLVVANTGAGKSIFLMNVAVSCFMGQNKLPKTDEELIDIVENNKWKKAHNVLFFSLEMPASEVIDRFLSNIANVNSLDILKGNIIIDEAERIKRALYYWEHSPYNIKVVDIPRGCSVDNLQKIYDETCLTFIPDVIIIDYLGLMSDTNTESEK